ncbi:hypothetical protein ACE1CI_04650 [Aerosakkonemataceae cyanobacterium BLCC-F50]|uniref:Uncharacterized protein n=1 Tax=Floridaenema flaviceps BLCC-F50 TaxID=3153642 RepID=A0ABV4XM93_9CYAN
MNFGRKKRSLHRFRLSHWSLVVGHWLLVIIPVGQASCLSFHFTKSPIPNDHFSYL